MHEAVNDDWRPLPEAPGLGLFVLWSEARTHERQIMSHLKRHFTVLGVHEVHWSPDRVAENYSRFYRVSASPPFRTSLPYYKGSGPFLAVVVLDQNPVLGERMTMGGVREVSTRVVDAKSEFRKWTGGGVKVHSSDTPTAAARELMLLLGVTPGVYLAERPGPWDGRVEPVHRNVTGSDGWADAAEMLSVLDVSTVFTILRHSDDRIDLLTSRYKWTLAITGAQSDARYPRRWGGIHSVRIAGGSFELVIRFVGDGYVDPAWAKHMLEHRRRDDVGRPVLTDEDQGMIDLYRALVLGDDLPASQLAPADASWLELQSFMDGRGYGFTRPMDRSVPFRPDGNTRFTTPLRTAVGRGADFADRYFVGPMRYAALSTKESILTSAPALRALVR